MDLVWFLDKQKIASGVKNKQPPYSPSFPLNSRVSSVDLYHLPPGILATTGRVLSRRRRSRISLQQSKKVLPSRACLEKQEKTPAKGNKMKQNSHLCSYVLFEHECCLKDLFTPGNEELKLRFCKAQTAKLAKKSCAGSGNFGFKQ